jgi:hypothetical protein
VTLKQRIDSLLEFVNGGGYKGPGGKPHKRDNAKFRRLKKKLHTRETPGDAYRRESYQAVEKVLLETKGADIIAKMLDACGLKGKVICHLMINNNTSRKVEEAMQQAFDDIYSKDRVGESDTGVE